MGDFGFADIKIIPSHPEYAEFCAWLEPIAAKLLESFMNCWSEQLKGKLCTHDPRHVDIHISGGQGEN